jgi:hypothetical protein
VVARLELPRQVGAEFTYRGKNGTSNWTVVSVNRDGSIVARKLPGQRQPPRPAAAPPAPSKKSPARKKMTPTERAARALAANRARIEAASNWGTASEGTLRQRGYDIDPHGGGPKASANKAGIPRQKRRRKKK